MIYTVKSGITVGIKNFFRCIYDLTTRVTGMSEILLVGHFLPCKFDLLSIYNDNIVPAINMWCETRLVFAPQDLGHL